MAATLQPPRASPRPATGLRLMAGPPPATGYEIIEDHERRLAKRPAGGAWLLDVIAQSGLRGRGGAWFPTGRKWAAVAESSWGNAVVVINCSEGEPLSSKDRALLSLRPHLILDGAALAAETVGATDVVLYMSRSSRGADAAIEKAIKERAHAGLEELPVRIVRTAHRYIAGESSALINRVSGGPSKPTFSLRRSAESGVDGRPTLVQNAETMAHVAMVARYGSAWFRQLGTEHAPGSMLVTLCGNVKHPGVYEVNLGARLGDVLAAAGGTVSPPAGALLGGYFGTWLPAHQLAQAPLDPDQLRAALGASLGCGVVAVLPRDGCGIVEATRILTYLTAESAAQCGPCVNGLTALSDAMERIAASQAAFGDLDNVRRWVSMVRGRGACHHPDGAVGQLESALGAFGDHLPAHIAGRACYGHTASGFPPPPPPGDRWR
jgi:NADH:ubiquinone oxidoreductase subunit F (NADH-binding)